MGLPIAINSADLFDQIRNLRKSIDECKAVWEAHRTEYEQVGKLLSAIRELNDDIQNPQLINVVRIYRFNFIFF